MQRTGAVTLPVTDRDRDIVHPLLHRDISLLCQESASDPLVELSAKRERDTNLTFVAVDP